MRIVSIVGARPQFVKLAVVAHALSAHAEAEHLIIHTGQHYDDAMSASFFRELRIPDPHYNLQVGSGSHGRQTAEMIHHLEPVLETIQPDWVLLYGDTNSTAAGAMTAAKLKLKIAHIEAGLRSFNRRMPEEINRVLTDHLSDLLFCPTQAGMKNLQREGLAERSVLCGDVMYDAVLTYLSDFETRQEAYSWQWKEREYALATVHRAENTDDLTRLHAILHGFEKIAAEVCPLVMAVHPRTRKALDSMKWQPSGVTLLPPLPYGHMLFFEKRARMILTDSGGVQKEAYFLRVPCITLRDETEWTETLENSCNVLAGANSPEDIANAARHVEATGPWEAHYGDGCAAQLIARSLLSPDHPNSASPEE